MGRSKQTSSLSSPPNHIAWLSRAHSLDDGERALLVFDVYCCNAEPTRCASVLAWENAQRSAPNIQLRKLPRVGAQFRASIPQFDVQRSIFGVRCLLL